jgi:hypothetical protein
MADNQYLLNQLQQLLSWKKSKKFYAEKLGIGEEEVESLLREIKESKEAIRTEAETSDYIGLLEDAVVKYEEDLARGVGEIIFNSAEEIRSLDELIVKSKIDTEKWEITKYVQNYWGNSKTPHWQVKAWMAKKSTEQLFQDSFVEFLKEYQPTSTEIESPVYDNKKSPGCLIINKQDSHLNKFDIDGNNDIYNRFDNILNKVKIIVDQAHLSNYVDTIFYVIGSDEFNSEFTGTTTKGTPQQNIDTYHNSFEKICEHEIQMITMLLQKTDDVQVVYVAGNHDEFVGWHMITWLAAYFKDVSRVTFDCSPKYRKYVSFGDTAMMFNHGDAMKPAKLASIFPIEYKQEWSNHNNFYIFTGDKHHEISIDFGGIKFYQIPAFSNAKSSWDEKNGYTSSRAEVTGFLIDFEQGMTNIFKQYL